LHNIGKEGILLNPKYYNSSDFIITVGGKHYAINKFDNLALKDHRNKTLKFKNVLYVPETKKNLLTIQQITKENPYNVVFSDKSFTIFYRRIGKVITHGLKGKKSYLLFEMVIKTFLQFN
jgi:hypothetical protein